MPLTTQLQQSNDSSRAIDPGPQSNTLGSLVSGLSGLTDSFRRGSETIRARESQQLQEKLSIRSDTRSQETHDTNQSEIQRGEHFRGIQNDYLEARDNLRLRREQGDLSSSSYELQLRTLIESTNSTNPGFRGEILTLTSELGDDQVAFTLSAIEEEQAAQDVASVGRLQALMDEEIANRGLGGLPRDTAESLVAEQQSAEVAANASLLAMRVTSAGRELQAGEGTAETSRLQSQAVAALNRRTSSQLSTLISANLAAVAAVDVTNPDEVAAGRDAIAAVDMRIAQARLALLQDTAGIPSAQRDETIAFFDNIAEQHSEQQETFGATRVRMLSDMQETFELDVTEATQVLSYLRDTFSPEEMMSEGFFGASGIPQRYIDRARAEVLGASDPAAQRASRLNTIRPHIAAGFVSPADLDGEDAVQYTRESRRDLSFGAENILGGEGGVVNESSARTFEDGVVGVVATVDALASGSTSDRISGILGASLANDQTLAAIHALNGDTAQRDRTGLMTSTYRRGVESLLDIERQRIRPNQFLYNSIQVGEDGIATVITSTPDALSNPGLSFGSSAGLGALNDGQRSDQRRAQEFAGRYNSLVHALVDTDQYSEARAFREATPETRQAFWASQGRSSLRDEEGEVLNPRQEQRARRVERESAAALRMQSLADIQQAAQNPATASEPAAAPATPSRAEQDSAAARGGAPEYVREAGFSSTPDSTVRGIRNNNPGNIEQGNVDWEGLSEDQSGDERFAQFDTPEHGLRAFARTLMTYGRDHGITTINGLVNRWAPPEVDGVVENDTEAYIAFVAKTSGIPADQEIDLDDPDTLAAIIPAMIRQENGTQPYAEEVIRRGVAMAGR